MLVFLGFLAIPLGMVPSQVINYLTGMLQAGKAVDFSQIWPAVVLIFVATMGIAGLDILKTFLSGLVLEQKVQSRILEIFYRLLRTSPEFYRKNESAKISKRVIYELRRVESFWLKQKIMLPLNLIGLIGFGYVLFFGLDQNTAIIGPYLPVSYSQQGNWFLAGMIILLAPLQTSILLFDKKIQNVNRRAMTVHDELADTSLETLDSVAEIRSHFAFDFAMSRVKHKLESLRRLEIDTTKLRSILSGIGPILDSATKAFLLVMGARLCLGNLHIPLTDITVNGIEWKDYLGFAGLAKVVNGYVKNLGDSLFEWRLTKETIQRVDEFNNVPLDYIGADEAPKIAGDKDPIDFNRLSVEIADGTRILNDINFKISPGEHVAFVGPSGCGKSTTMGLLIRELRQSAGELLFADKKVGECDFVSLSRELGHIRQKPILLNESLRSNILFGMEQTTLGDEQLNALLTEVVDKVGLKKDLIKKALDNPLPERYLHSALVSALPDLRNRLADMVRQDHATLIEFFNPETFLFTGTLLENILYGMTDVPTGGNNLDTLNGDIVRAVANAVGNEPIFYRLLWLGWQTFLHDQKVAMRIKLQTPKQFEILSGYGLAEEHIDDMVHRIDDNFSTLKSTKQQIQRLLLTLALESDARQALSIMADDSFVNEILTVRRTLMQKPLAVAVSSFTLDSAQRAIPLRDCLLGGRVNLAIHGAQAEVDRLIMGVLEQSGLIDQVVLAGLETPAGPKGQRLSGGQAMKVAIARILFKQPNVLLLDEATAALDEKSQAQIVDLIENDFKGKTVISISHRLSTIKDYDRILVFDRGQVVQQGTYNELTAVPGLFRDLVQQEKGDAPGSLTSMQTLPDEISSSEIRRALALSSVFHALTTEQITLVERLARIEECPSGTVLFHRGDSGDELYIVLVGEVEFFTEQEGSDQKESVDIYGPGGTFGELAVFGRLPRTLGARTIKDSRFCVLTREHLEELIEIDSAIALSLMELLSQRTASVRDMLYASLK